MIRRNPRRLVREVGERSNRPRIYQGYLAEDYDGIGRYVMVLLSGGSTSAGFRAKVGAGDFGTGQVIPAGTYVSIYVGRGKVALLTLGAK